MKNYDYKSTELAKLNEKHEAVKSRLAVLEDKLLDGESSAADFTRIKTRYELVS